MSQSTKITIVGAGGRMGRALIRLIEADDNLQLGAALEYSGSPLLGTPVADLIGGSENEQSVSADKEMGLEVADAVIDFSSIESSLETARLCAEKKTPLVVGTTGFDAGQRSDLLSAGQKIPFLWAPNMSLGVNVLFKLAEQVASILTDAYDVEIIEAHHNRKVDAPSGTATRLKEQVLKGLNRQEKDVVYGRHGMTGQRPRGEVGVHAIRAGAVVGDHTVLYAGPSERIELRHIAESRDAFAEGALRAARYLATEKKDQAGVYTMEDVLFPADT